ncbi:protein FAM186A isoform X2 [Drosophila santomea]|uniref:protein FAM186A isoform X2 n=1 Tax=Drosophila santomea TaxID=129105 RepID=UPI001953C1D8|nr:protein FAM186A isoform X2 [Drosophila santomea]
MPSRKRLENKARRRRNPVQLNDFLRGDDEPIQITTPLSSNESQSQTPSTPNANTSSIGTIPSKDLFESDVTPVMTPTPQTDTYQPTVNVWRSPKETTQPEANYNVSAEEYPDLGKRLKRAKQPTPTMTNLENGATGSRLRSRRSRIINPPVLANFLPDSVLPTSSNSKQQSVANWLSSVRSSDSHGTANDQASCSFSNKITLLRRDSAQELGQKSAAQSSPKEKHTEQQQQNTPAEAQEQQNTPPKVQEQQTIPASAVKHQQKSSVSSLQQQKVSAARSLSQEQKKSSGNLTQQQQQSSVSFLQQQKESPARSLPQEQKKSSGNLTQQQQKSSVSSLQQQKESAARSLSQEQKKSSGNLTQQQQQSSVSFLQQQKESPARSLPQEQKKSSGNLTQQQQKSFVTSLQQRKESVAKSFPQEQKKSSGNLTQQQQKSFVTSLQQRKESVAKSFPQEQKKSSGNLTQQQQKSSVSFLQQRKESVSKSLPQEQKKSSGNLTQQQQKSSVSFLQQRKESVAKSLPQEQRTSSNLSQQQQKSSVSFLQQQKESPSRSFPQEQKKSSGNLTQQQQKSFVTSLQQRKESVAKSLPQEQKKSFGNLTQQQQKSSVTSLQQRKESVAKSLPQEQKKSSGNLTQQQQKSSVSFLQQQKESPARSFPQEQKKSSGNLTQQQQKSFVTSLQQRKESVAKSLPQEQKKSFGNLTQQQQKSSVTSLQQRKESVAKSLPQEQKKSSGNLTQQQQKSSVSFLQQQKESPARSFPQEQKKSFGNLTQQQQKSSVTSLQQRKERVARSLPQEQRTSSGNLTQQQQKSSESSRQQQQKIRSPGKLQQQQQKSPANTVGNQKKRKSPGIQQAWHQQMSPGNSFQQEQHKSSGGTLTEQQQQPKSLAKTLKHQPKSPTNSVQQQQHHVAHSNQSRAQSARPVKPIHSRPKSQERKAPVTNNFSVSSRLPTDERIQQPTQFSGPSNANDVDEEVVPPTPNNQSERMPRRFPRRGNNRRVVRSLQAFTREFTQSSPEASPEGLPEGSPEGLPEVLPERSPVGSPEGSPEVLPEGSPEVLPEELPEESPQQEVVQCKQHEQPQQVKSLPENEPNCRMHQLAMHSALNSDALEFRPAERREAGGFSERAQVCRLSRRRRRQRFLRSLHVEPLLPSYELVPSEPLRPVCHVPDCCYYRAPPSVITPEIVQPPSPQRLPVTVPVQPMMPPTTIEVFTTSNPPPMVVYNPQSGNLWSNPSPYMPIEIENNRVSQSVFRLASLPCTGVGTPTTDSFTSWPPPSQHHSPSRLPSSISGPSQFSHTLSSPPVKRQQHQKLSPSIIHQDEDLLYSRSLLDMDREETQWEQQGQEWQWESPQESSRFQSQPLPQPQVVDDVHGVPNADVAKDAGPPLERHKIFRAPSQHGQDYPKPDLNCVPSSIKKLHRLISSQYSDYSFVYAMSAQLSQDCVPMDCYVYLKMVLLASIVSIESDEVRAPISLCIIATDSLMANRLMNKVGQLAPRYLGPHDYGLQPTFSALPTRFNWIVASPLLLAQQGVYHAGDWTRLSKEQGCQLEKCIENGAVPVPQLHIDQPLEAAVWTHWQPDNSSNQTQALAKLCPIFGLPIYMGAQVNKSLWNFIIQQHSAEGQNVVNDGLNIPEDDMRMLIHLLHQRKTTLTDGAQHMLQKYYVISRKERPTVFSSKTYIVLKQFAECFAKLALRLEVLESDVCVAIFHCEHFVQSIFGAKENQAPPAVINFNVISCIDPYMNEFARWLLQYLDSYEDEELGMNAAKRRRTDSWGMP